MLSVIQSRDIVSYNDPSCVESPEGFTFCNTCGEELLEPDDTETCPSPATDSICGSINPTQHHTYPSIADNSYPGSQSRKLDFFPWLPNYLLPLSLILEED